MYTRRRCHAVRPGAPYDLVKGDVYAILPFGNSIITRTVTGKQIWSMLENGVSRFAADGTNGQGRFVQASGLKYTFHYQNPTGCTGDDTDQNSWVCSPSRVTEVTLTDGTPIPNDSTTYTMATTNFTNAGGDAMWMLADGQGVTFDLDANVMLDYMLFAGPVFDPTPIRWIASPSCPDVRTGGERPGGSARPLRTFADGRGDRSTWSRRSIGRVLLRLLVVVRRRRPCWPTPGARRSSTSRWTMSSPDGLSRRSGPSRAGRRRRVSLSLAGQTADLGTVVAGPDGHFEAPAPCQAFPVGYASLVATADEARPPRPTSSWGPTTGPSNRHYRSSPLWADPR